MWLPDSHSVSNQGLDNLKLYKYAAVDKSFLTKYFLRHYWEWAVTLFPLWMAEGEDGAVGGHHPDLAAGVSAPSFHRLFLPVCRPNLITLLGLGFILANLLLVVVFVPDLVGPAPSWMYFSFAIGLWLYSTFDNVDGKQARRTNSSSPLGELFDHGCDALNCSRQEWVSAPRGTPWQFSSWVSGAGNMILPRCQQHVFFLFCVAGVTILLSALSHYDPAFRVASNAGAPGARFAAVTLRSDGLRGSTSPPFPFADASLADVICAGMFFLLVTTHLPFSLLAVSGACRKKGESLGAAVRELAPMLSCILAGWAWLAAPGSVALRRHFVLFTLTVGIVFGRFTVRNSKTRPTKIILAHVTKMPFPHFTVLLVPLYVGAALARWGLFSPSSERLFLILYFLFALAAYLRWAFLVIDRFCTFLKISCFTIPHAGPSEASGRKRKGQ
ncbi:MAG: CDP-alcohol phosphatidyltransferase-domain-containing protein [Olpidium bornovanus]|uniref:CDP-alcohol phosphatidyltransferase-domain-containing protein n=1 Tax=Olpidium bornovanus TaxID=278681 RepID=A0A8H8A296_9FUNG|nr:MAG: CDP-alcohol phosphatidyltransferase-domain-containing protein [Olpidium bornovanus]